MKYRKEMRYKSSVDVSAKRSHALTKRKKGGIVVVPIAKKTVMSPVSRQVSNMSCGSDSINNIGIGANYPDVVNMGLPQISNIVMPSNNTMGMFPVPRQLSNISYGNDTIDIGVGTNYPDVVNLGLPQISNIVMPSSPTTYPSNEVIGHQNSFFFDSGHRAPSPMALPQQPTLDDNNSKMAVAEEGQDTIFSFVSQDGSEDNVVEHLPSHWQVKQNIFDEVDKEFYGGNENDNDSVEGSLGVVSNSASSSSGSSLQDVQSDIEDCLEVMAEILETSR